MSKNFEGTVLQKDVHKIGTMKCMFAFLATILFTQSFGQVINGTIRLPAYEQPGTIWVSAKNVKYRDHKFTATNSDSQGRFKLQLPESGKYRVQISSALFPDTTFYTNIGSGETLDLVIRYPPKLCPYEETRLTGICPEGSHKDNVIPILYGLIVGDRDFLKKVERNEIELGGCVVTDCDPNWYCKAHDRRF